MHRIRQLREGKNESQTALADAVGSSIRSVQNWESGKTTPSQSKLETIAQHYGVTVAYLFEDVTNDISINESTELYTTKAGSVIEELDNGRYLLSVSLVPHKAHAMYLQDFTDAEFIDSLTRVSFIVDRVPKGNYQAWEIKNDSMMDGSINSIPDGSIVLGREVGRQHWKNKLHTKNYPYWIIVHKESIVCKEIIEHDVDKGIITCHSLNDSLEYQDFKINLDDCHKLFNIIKKQI